MATSPRLTKSDAGSTSPPITARDEAVVHRLKELLAELQTCSDPLNVSRANAMRAKSLWESVKISLEKTAAPQDRVQKILAGKNTQMLTKLVSQLVPGSATATAAAEAASAVTDDRGETPSATPASGTTPSSDALKAAMKAFRKRLKLTRLDEESKLGHKAMSSGRKSAIVAILPPREFPKAVWDELVNQGKLRDATGGFLELAEE